MANDEYEDPGPDPQPVDFDWLESIRKGKLTKKEQDDE